MPLVDSLFWRAERTSSTDLFHMWCSVRSMSPSSATLESAAAAFSVASRTKPAHKDSMKPETLQHRHFIKLSAFVTTRFVQKLAVDAADGGAVGVVDDPCMPVKLRGRSRRKSDGSDRGR